MAAQLGDEVARLARAGQRPGQQLGRLRPVVDDEHREGRERVGLGRGASDPPRLLERRLGAAPRLLVAVGGQRASARGRRAPTRGPRPGRRRAGRRARGRPRRTPRRRGRWPAGTGRAGRGAAPGGPGRPPRPPRPPGAHSAAARSASPGPARGGGRGDEDGGPVLPGVGGRGRDGVPQATGRSPGAAAPRRGRARRRACAGRVAGRPQRGRQVVRARSAWCASCAGEPERRAGPRARRGRPRAARPPRPGSRSVYTASASRACRKAMRPSSPPRTCAGDRLAQGGVEPRDRPGAGRVAAAATARRSGSATRRPAADAARARRWTGRVELLERARAGRRRATRAARRPRPRPR